MHNLRNYQETRILKNQSKTDYPVMIGINEIAIKLVSGCDFYELYQPYIPDNSNPMETSFYKYKFIMRYRLEAIYKVEKLLFDYYLEYGNYEISPRMLTVMKSFTDKRIHVLRLIINSLIRAGWTPKIHVTLTRINALNNKHRYRFLNKDGFPNPYHRQT